MDFHLPIQRIAGMSWAAQDGTDVHDHLETPGKYRRRWLATLTQLRI